MNYGILSEQEVILSEQEVILSQQDVILSQQEVIRSLYEGQGSWCLLGDPQGLTCVLQMGQAAEALSAASLTPAVWSLETLVAVDTHTDTDRQTGRHTDRQTHTHVFSFVLKYMKDNNSLCRQYSHKSSANRILTVILILILIM